MWKDEEEVYRKREEIGGMLNNLSSYINTLFFHRNKISISEK